MSPRLDAHAHLFRPGFVGHLPASCRRIAPDELTLYSALATRNNIEGVLAVGYEGEPWAVGNNAYLAELAHSHEWIWPVAFVANPAELTTTDLTQLAQDGFIGLSFYLFDGTESQLAQVNADIWQWLIEHHWLISVNGKREAWTAWQPILQQFNTLCVLIAHLGLPPSHATAPSASEAAAMLAPIITLADYPGVHVKLSGFYGLTDPAYDYPHTAAWPYVDILISAFGINRLVWGSDFSPALEFVSFNQTIAVIEHLPGLTESDKEAIYGGNLRRLLDALGSGSSA